MHEKGLACYIYAFYVLSKKTGSWMHYTNDFLDINLKLQTEWSFGH